jgi:hypothetical protein
LTQNWTIPAVVGSVRNDLVLNGSAGSKPLGTGSVTIGSGSALWTTAGNSVTIGALAGSGHYVIDGAVTVDSPNGADTTYSGGNAQASGRLWITSPGSLTKTGRGILTISNTNTSSTPRSRSSAAATMTACCGSATPLTSAVRSPPIA